MHRILLLAALTVLLASACREAPALAVGTVTYAEEELLGLTPARREALATLTAFGLAVAADQTGAAGEPLVRRRVRRHLGELLRAQRLFDSLAIGEDALRNHYTGSPQLELTVRHLIVLSERYEPESTRSAAREKAARALARVRAGEPFPEVAAQVSEEPGAEGRQGLLSPGREGSWVREFWDAARALEVGEISPVVETRYGFHVLRLEDRRAIPFEEARSAVTLDVARMLGLVPSDEPPVPAPPGLRVHADAALRLMDAALADAAPVAEWAGGELPLGELRDHLASAGETELRALLDDPAALGSEVERAVRWRLAAEEAAARGHAPDPAVAETARLDWQDRTRVWAASLGFRPGQRGEAVKRVALEALRTSAQNAALARGELLEQGHLFRRAPAEPGR